MAHAGFVHLRVHSAYSLLEGALKLDRLVAMCRDQAMPAVAVTDTGNLFGALEFAQSAQAAGVQPIIGCQLAVGGPRGAAGSLVLLAQDQAGYGHLMKLVSKFHLETAPGDSPQVGFDDLEALGGGLIALTGGPAGPVGRLLLAGRDEDAAAILLNLSRIFPGRLYVELMRHGLPEEARSENRFIGLAHAHGLPLVATNEAFFADAAMYEAHDALLAIAEGAYVAQEDRRRVTPEHRFKTAAEMADLFADLPEAVRNTLAVARRCAFFPEEVAPILPRFSTTAGRSEAAELRARADSGLGVRLETQVFEPGMDDAAREATARRYRERQDYELGVIEQMGYSGYFLIVADFIQWAKQEAIPVGPGRGSGAGSVVSWALTITDLDPLRWGLLFERFLNPERVSMSDFDVDFCQERRDEVIRYVRDKYGHDRVAQIITFGKLQARAALRDVGRVLQMPYSQVDRICKLVPNNPANSVTLAQAIDAEPRLREMRDQDQAVARLMDIALGIEGLYRHASTHAAGVVIGDRRLDELVPLYRDPRSDMPVTQFSMKHVEKAGLVKFDFLGLKTLTVLARARDMVAERGTEIDLSRIPLDDARTFAMLGRGETVGVFQLESSGMREVIKRLKPERFEDIIALVALYRPGPMDNIPSYIARKQGLEAPDYLYPSLEGILKETFGIMIYQEQVMQIAQELAGYSLGGADLLRRAMGKKIRSEMEAQRKNFVEGAVARGVPRSKASKIFEQVSKFAGYGFPKGHAAPYAMLAFQTAYLKANHPVEFLAACMTLDMGNTDKLSVFGQELRRLGIPLLPPDVNRSRADFSVESSGGERGAIRYALGAIRNVGEAAMRALVAERQERGPFNGVLDFALRLDSRTINKRQIENLACAGALDAIDPNRRQAFEGAESIVRRAASAADERESQQINLFDSPAQAPGAKPRPASPNGARLDREGLPYPPTDDWTPMERQRREFAAIGFYLSAHPLDAHEGALRRLGAVPAADLPRILERESGRKRVGGVVIGLQERTSRQGNRFAFAQLSDTSGIFEVVVFSDLLSRSRETLTSGEPLLLTVEARGDGEGMRLMAHEIEPLAAGPSGQEGADLKVFLADRGQLDSLKSVLAREGQGRDRVRLVVDLDHGREAEIELPAGYRLTAAVRQAIKAIPGLIVQEA